MNNREQLLLEFFKAMANEQRLQIAAALIQHEHTAAELAELLQEKPAVVLEHLAALRQLGLVTAQTQPGRTAYAFDRKALYELNRSLLSRENLPTPVDSIADEQTRRTLRNFFDGDRLISLPESNKKFHLLVKWLVTCFDEGVRYSEQEVNQIILRYHEDYATLRRAMIEAGLMQRERGIYWRVA